MCKNQERGEVRDDQRNCSNGQTRKPKRRPGQRVYEFFRDHFANFTAIFARQRKESAAVSTTEIPFRQFSKQRFSELNYLSDIRGLPSKDRTSADDCLHPRRVVRCTPSERYPGNSLQFGPGPLRQRRD